MKRKARESFYQPTLTRCALSRWARVERWLWRGVEVVIAALLLGAGLAWLFWIAVNAAEEQRLLDRAKSHAAPCVPVTKGGQRR